jgi:hypothetical protein
LAAERAGVQGEARCRMTTTTRARCVMFDITMSEP